jgi:hypothetical protein
MRAEDSKLEEVPKPLWGEGDRDAVLTFAAIAYEMGTLCSKNRLLTIKKSDFEGVLAPPKALVDTPAVA